MLARTLTDMRVVSKDFDTAEITFGGSLRKNAGRLLALSGVAVCTRVLLDIKKCSGVASSGHAFDGCVGLVIVAFGFWTGRTKRWVFDRKTRQLSYSFSPIWSSKFLETDTRIDFERIQSIGVSKESQLNHPSWLSSFESISILKRDSLDTVQMDWGRLTQLFLFPVPGRHERTLVAARQLHVLFVVFSTFQPSRSERARMQSIFNSLDEVREQSHPFFFYFYILHISLLSD